MKCPYRFTVTQQNYAGYFLNENSQLIGDNHILLETQEFRECYKEECTAWDKKKKICRKVKNK